ncbi:MAG: hypothetical protein QW607_09650 [Desulfurococcaceae archaeon]
MQICPRCGLPGKRRSESRGKRRYIYFIHYDKETKRTIKHYVGPLLKYKYVEQFHGIDLDNIIDTNYLKTAWNSLVKYVRQNNSRDKRELIRELVEFKRKIDKLIDEIWSR